MEAFARKDGGRERGGVTVGRVQTDPWKAEAGTRYYGGSPGAAVGWGNRLGWDGPRERRVGVRARAARYKTADPAGGGGGRTEEGRGGMADEIFDSWNRSFDGWLFSFAGS